MAPESGIVRDMLGQEWCKAVDLVRTRVNEDWYRPQRGRWARKAHDVCRVLRLMADRARRPVMMPGNSRGIPLRTKTWGEAVADCATLANAGGKRAPFRAWAKAARQIAGNMKTRKGYPVDKVTVKSRDILSLLHEQGFRCAYTGDPLTPENLSADHVVPVQHGGSHDLGNIRLTTREVNQAKGTLMLGEFADLCAKVARCLGGTAPEPAPLAPEATTADACEVLARLGLTDAAEEVRALREKAKRIDRRLLKAGRPTEGEAEKRAKIAALSIELQQLQSRRSVLRKQIAAAGGDGSGGVA